MKKGKVNKPFKTVKLALANPYSDEKPRLTETDYTKLKDVLENSLSGIKKKKNSLPYSMIKDKTPEERRLLRKQLLNNSDCNEYSKEVLKYLKFGINAIHRLVNRNEAACVLLKHNVEHEIMINHVIDACLLKKVPLVLSINLDTELLRITGTSATGLALVKAIPETYKDLNLLNNMIQELYSQYPFKHADIYEKVEAKEELSDNKKIRKLHEVVFTQKEKNLTTDEVYLYREPNSTLRIFVPTNTIINQLKRKDSDTTINETYAANDMKNDEQFVSKYKKMKIKRIKGNTNRKKK